MRGPFAFAVVLVFGLSGCGGGATTGGEGTEATSPDAERTVTDEAIAEETTASPEPEIYAPGEFEATTPEGASITMQIPSEPVEDIEAFREQVGAPPVTYMTLQIDNRQGSTSVSVYQVTLYDPEGNSYVFQDPSTIFIGEWGPTFTGDYVYILPDGTELDEATGDELSRQSTDLYNKYLESGTADQLERTEDNVMMGAFTEVPQEITGVAVEAYGAGDPVFATPVE